MAVSTLALGYNSTIETCDANDGLFTPATTLGGWTTGNLTFRRSSVDSTNVDTGGYEGKEYGLIGLSLSFECLDDQNGDTGQDTLLSDFNAGTKRYMRVRPRVGTGYLQWVFQAVINNAAWTLEQGGLARFSFACDSDGTITKSDQS